MFSWFRVIATALASIAASQKSIAISAAAIAQGQNLSEADRAAISAATAGLHASHDRLEAALENVK